MTYCKECWGVDEKQILIMVGPECLPIGYELYCLGHKDLLRVYE